MTGLRADLSRLMDLLEGLHAAEPSLDAVACPQETKLKNRCPRRTASRSVRRAEDPVDAVVCAYIARFARTRPDDVTVYGDPATGCIVTPTLAQAVHQVQAFDVPVRSVTCCRNRRTVAGSACAASRRWSAAARSCQKWPGVDSGRVATSQTTVSAPSATPAAGAG